MTAIHWAKRHSKEAARAGKTKKKKRLENAWHKLGEKRSARILIQRLSEGKVTRNMPDGILWGGVVKQRNHFERQIQPPNKTLGNPGKSGFRPATAKRFGEKIREVDQIGGQKLPDHQAKNFPGPRRR